MEQVKSNSLWTRVRSGDAGGQFLRNAKTRVVLSGLGAGSAFTSSLHSMADRSVLIWTADQLVAALALIELDGVAKRLVLCPPGLAADDIPVIVRDAGIDTIVIGLEDQGFPEIPGVAVMQCNTGITGKNVERISCYETEWVLLTSGTTGRPKMAVHSLASLTGAIQPNATASPSLVWATFYDIRRYGGLQIFLRAVLGGGSLILSCAGEPLNAHLERLGREGVTHLTGTPSHWRRVLMSTSAREIAPHYVRLSGEIADQGVLDGLRALYPDARIVHAYASTEAGVGFEVDDEKEGFPAGFIGLRPGGVELAVHDGCLRIRSARAARHYLTAGSGRITGDNGFVDTGDLVALRGGRYFFVGRKDGVINVGGQKVHPEEVEAVINKHPGVRMSLVHAKKSAIIGAVAVAEIVPASEAFEGNGGAWMEVLEGEIRDLCASHLDRHKVPALIRFVPSLAMSESGKLARHNA
jgi:acyl-coenzyme A synthetase/AMP-(fatty) acid ligase